jgi:hypothetical protein
VDEREEWLRRFGAQSLAASPPPRGPARSVEEWLTVFRIAFARRLAEVMDASGDPNGAPTHDLPQGADIEGQPTHVREPQTGAPGVMRQTDAPDLRRRQAGGRDVSEP